MSMSVVDPSSIQQSLRTQGIGLGGRFSGTRDNTRPLKIWFEKIEI